ncbi:phage tail tape measure protein, partial [Gammaproteobacteria bacterium]|nr:phage tail tape measure protein [Gammaproteobacteria bacterium]
MANRFEKLLISVALIDRASGPASRISQNIDNLTSRATAGMNNMARGAAGLFATGYALRSIMQPAIEMDRALGQVESLGVATSALKMLERTALSTSISYGLSATDIVGSSYDIQSAISGLTDNELASFTRSSAILAKATKSDTAVITDYMGTMYGIFKNTADSMGKSQWVEQLTGQTATAVQMFKTTGTEMASSFTNLGAEAQSAGIGMEEQLAVLGTLQATMSGSQAGTKYKAFLAGVGRAQDSLGLQFTDSQGKLLPMLDILEKLQGKFGDTFDVAESDALKQAFGSAEATGLIKLLMQDTNGLAASIDSLSNVQGMQTAETMAKSMVDTWQQLGAANKAVATVFGQVLQPVLTPLIESFVRGAEKVQRWTGMFPNLTRVVGLGVLTIFGLVAAVSAFALISGIASIVAAGWSGALLVHQGVMAVWGGMLKLQTLSVNFFRASALAAAISIKGLNLGFLSSLAPIWAFTAALFANPITWIVLGIAALVAAIVGLIFYW